MTSDFDPFSDALASGAIAGDRLTPEPADALDSGRTGKGQMLRLTRAQNAYVRSRQSAGRSEKVPWAVVVRFLVGLGIEEDTRRLAETMKRRQIERTRAAAAERAREQEAMVARGPVPVPSHNDAPLPAFRQDVGAHLVQEPSQWGGQPPPAQKPRHVPDFDPTALGNPFRDAP